ncbi:uracil-DNA glycosylase [Azorhizobium oxalatiphilum]|uniref:Type-4 uracil-DNA glycosylase n=1 Tax=Azorhizobium oxalatiphilum TaxID=980631 RepID=A0A917BNR9_9HYPH|nr:uracil-DNA glycosylase [Azorhizobium oxalatiphilum]GGF51068.1 uracil-DNA glycosylase [Azorhizobium oxalatiphilum]
MNSFVHKQFADILAFYAEAGVDVAVGEEPVDRFAESAAEQASRSARSVQPGRSADSRAAPDGQRPAQPMRPAAPQPGPMASGLHGTPHGAPLPPQVAAQHPDEAVMAARDAARTATSLDELKGLLEAFDGCPLKRTATRLVFADGNPQAKVMFVGEAPGRDEDVQGLPFVGRSGRLLDLMMAAIGLDRTSAYIANVIPWRPPGNRTPTPQETAICLPFIKRQVELANPDILVCMGGPAAQSLLGITDGITKARGRVMPYETGSRTIKAIATFHPAYLLRTPLGKRLAWRDLLAIEALLKGEG